MVVVDDYPSGYRTKLNISNVMLDHFLTNNMNYNKFT